VGKIIHSFHNIEFTDGTVYCRHILDAKWASGVVALNYTLRHVKILSRRICVLCLIITVHFTLLREAHSFIRAFVCTICCSDHCATRPGFKCPAH